MTRIALAILLTACGSVQERPDYRAIARAAVEAACAVPPESVWWRVACALAIDALEEPR